jgi:hypothetical protein
MLSANSRIEVNMTITQIILLSSLELIGIGVWLWVTLKIIKRLNEREKKV